MRNPHILSEMMYCILWCVWACVAWSSRRAGGLEDYLKTVKRTSETKCAAWPHVLSWRRKGLLYLHIKSKWRCIFTLICLKNVTSRHCLKILFFIWPLSDFYLLWPILGQTFNFQIDLLLVWEILQILIQYFTWVASQLSFILYNCSSRRSLSIIVYSIAHRK